MLEPPPISFFALFTPRDLWTTQNWKQIFVFYDCINLPPWISVYIAFIIFSKRSLALLTRLNVPALTLSFGYFILFFAYTHPFYMLATPESFTREEEHSQKNKQRFKEMLKNQNKKKLRHKHFVSSSAYCIPLGTSRLNVRLGLAGSLLQFVREKTPGEIGRNQGCVRKHPGC